MIILLGRLVTLCNILTYSWRIPVDIRHQNYPININHIRTYLFRPPDILVGGLRFYRDSSIFYFRQLPSELAERNSTKNEVSPI